MRQHFRQIGIFVGVGLVNTVIDAGILNVLLFISGTTSVVGYALLKSVSFTIANINSYILNTRFTFKASRSYQSFATFFITTLSGMAVNVGLSAVVFSFAKQMVNHTLAANIGIIAGTAASMVINFILYKYVVFRKNQTISAE